MKKGFKVTIKVLLALFIVGVFIFIYGSQLPSAKPKVEISIGYRLKKNRNLDVWIEGDSSARNGIIPQVLYRNTGLMSYNSGEDSNRINRAYSYTLDMLEYQKPKLIIYETDMIIYKLDETFDCSITSYDGFFERLYNNHDAWRSASVKSVIEDKGYPIKWEKTAYKKGYSYLDTNPSFWMSDEEIAYMTEYNNYLKEQGIKLLLVTLPNPTVGNAMMQSSIKSFAESNDIDFIDFNYPDELSEYDNQIDLTTDMCDKMHLNVYGAKKATDYISYYINNNMSISAYDDNDDYKESVENYLEKYSKYLN